MAYNQASSNQLEMASFEAYCREESKNYTIKMYISSCSELIISCILPSSLKNTEYIFQDNYQNMLSNKFFLPFESIEEIKSFIVSLISNNSEKYAKNYITKKKDSLFLEIPAPLGKTKALFFELKQNLEYTVKNLTKEMGDLKAENEKIKLDIEKIKKELDNKIAFLETENKNKTIEIDNLKKLIFKDENDSKGNYNDSYHSNNEEQINNFTDSQIIRLDEREDIIKMINPEANMDTYMFKLIFRASRDGYTPNSFHAHCDKKGPSIIFIKITNGRRIGGYTSISWTSDNKFEKDEQAFLFSLDNKEKYELNKNQIQFSVAHFENYGPTFGSGYGLFIANDYKGDGNSSQEDYCYKTKNKDFIGIDQSKAYFSISDYEVYSINFN